MYILFLAFPLNEFLPCTEQIIHRAYTEKVMLVDRCIARVDLLKLLLQLAWEMQALDTKKYIHLSEYLAEVGRMLGGWRKQLANKPPAG